jgi:hypothetical protein
MVEKASANCTVLPAARVKVPEPVEMILPFRVAVDKVEVEILLATTPRKVWVLSQELAFDKLRPKV